MRAFDRAWRTVVVAKGPWNASEMSGCCNCSCSGHRGRMMVRVEEVLVVKEPLRSESKSRVVGPMKGGEKGRIGMGVGVLRYTR